MSSQASRTSFSKFTLKPSALSQLTANFNRKLEEIEVPKIEPIDLIGREANSHSNQENINKDGTKTDGTEGTSSTSSNQAAAPSKEFLFGENITERVVNKPEPTSTSAAATGEGGESTAEATSEATNGESDDKTGEKQPSSNLPTTSSSNNISSWLNDSENTEKYAAALHESDLYTLCKLNCKLYVLEADKANWLERGYGILKVIETNDGNNCKIMMWTDKCFRVILNTKFFEKMKIDRANNKSLRFNAFDNGTIRIFLIKATNQNDCDELQNVLSSRLELFLSTLQSSKSSASNSQEADDADDSTSRTSRKVTKFKCDCTVSRDSNPSQSIRAKIHLYMLEAGSSDSVTSPPPPSNSHQLFLEINEAFDSDQKINLNSYLKLVKIKKQKITSGKKAHKYLKFEIVDLAQAKSNIKYNVCINDRASASQFFSLYKKEPKFTSPDDSSSNGTNAFDKDLDDDQQEGVDNEEDEEDDSEESDENEDEDDDGEKSSSSSASSRSRPRSPPSNDDDSLLDRTNNSSITAATNDETSASNVLKRKSDVSDSDVRLAKKPGLDESAVAAEEKSEEKSEEKKDEGEEKKEASESVPVVPTTAAPSCGGGGTKRNLEDSVTSEGGDDSAAADENEGSSGMKKTKVSTEETSQD